MKLITKKPISVKLWANFKCISPSKRSQSEKVTYRMIPTKRHSGKGKSKLQRQ